MNIGEVHLDNGYLNGGDSVAYGIAVVGVSSRVDDYSALVAAGGVYAVDYLALVIALEYLAAVEAKLRSFFLDIRADVGVAVGAVDARLTLA